MWEDILKVQELQGVTSVLPKIESQEESDGPCKRKLQEIYDFWDEYVTEREKPSPKLRFNVKKKMTNNLNLISEKAACAALEILKEMVQGRLGYPTDTDGSILLQYHPIWCHLRWFDGGFLIALQKQSNEMIYQIQIELENPKFGKDVKAYLVKQFEKV